MMNENQIIETLKYISKFVENRYDEGLGDYLHIVIGRTDINVIDETIYLLEKQQKEIEELKEKQDYARLEKEQLLEDSISKDKIRELLKSKDIELTGVISYRELEELLEEK